MFDFSPQTLIIIWLILTLGSVILEAITCEIVSMWFAIGAALTTIFSIWVGEFILQLSFFMVISFLLTYFFRPIVLRRLRSNDVKFNIHAIVGKLGVVTKEVTALEKGEVKQGSALWLAKSSDNTKIELDTTVEVVSVEGATLIVKKTRKEVN